MEFYDICFVFFVRFVVNKYNICSMIPTILK